MEKISVANALDVLKAPSTHSVDVNLEREAEGVRALTDQGIAEPGLQRLLLHRRRLLLLMAAFYVLSFGDYCWTMATSLQSFDSIVRCPSAQLPDFVMNGVVSDAELRTYFNDPWGSCEADHIQYRYMLSDDDDGSDAARSETASCFYKGEDSNGSLTLRAFPFSNILANSMAEDYSSVYAEGFSFSASMLNEPAVAMKVAVLGDDIVDAAAEKLFPMWRVSGYPSCQSSAESAQFVTSFNTSTATYDVYCLDDDESEDPFTLWLYASLDEDIDLSSVLFATGPTLTTLGLCGDFPATSRRCCSNEEVIESSKNTPPLIQVKTVVKSINLILSFTSAILAIVAAYNWYDVSLSRRLALMAWLAPFLVSCLVAMLPLAYLARLDGVATFDDFVAKVLDENGVESSLILMELVLPLRLAELIQDNFLEFIRALRENGGEYVDVFMQLAFRLKTMAATLWPLAMTALAMPEGVSDAAINMKELFPSQTWIGWIVRLMPVFYLPWAVAIACTMAQIYAGPYVTSAIFLFLMAKVMEYTLNANAHTSSHASASAYREHRALSRLESVGCATLQLCCRVFLVAAVLTDTYLQEYGLKAIFEQGSVDYLIFEAAHFAFSAAVTYVAKKANTMIIFTDLMSIMVANITLDMSSSDDRKCAAALSNVAVAQPSLLRNAERGL